MENNEFFAKKTDSYLTRDQLKSSYLNDEELQEAIRTLEEYRNYFREKTIFKGKKSSDFYICYVPSLYNNLMKIMGLFSKINDMIYIINDISKKTNKNLLQEIKEAILRRELESINVIYDLKIANIYLEGNDTLLDKFRLAIGKIKTADKSDDFIKVIEDMAIQIGCEKYRDRPIDDKLINDVSPKRDEYFVDTDKITIQLSQLNTFIFHNENEYSPFLELIQIILYFYYISPIEKYNLLLATLIGRYYLQAKYDLPFFEYFPLFTVLTKNKKNFKNLYIEMINTNDMTFPIFDFIYNTTIELKNLANDIKNILDKAKVSFSLNISDQFKQNFRNEEEDFNDNLSSSDLQLPSNNLPIEEYRKYLIEHNPTMKQHQIEFISLNHTIGSQYTVKQYMDCVHCTYETARSSLRELTKAGIYREKTFPGKGKGKNVYSYIGREN